MEKHLGGHTERGQGNQFELPGPWSKTPVNQLDPLDWSEVDFLRKEDIDYQIFEYAFRRHEWNLSRACKAADIPHEQGLAWKRLCQLPNHQDWVKTRVALLKAISEHLISQGWTCGNVAQRYQTSRQAVGRYAREVGNGRAKREMARGKEAIRNYWAAALRSRGCSEEAIQAWLREPAFAPSLNELDETSMEGLSHAA